MKTHHDSVDTECSDILGLVDEPLPEPLDYWDLEDFNDILPRNCHAQYTSAVYATTGTVYAT